MINDFKQFLDDAASNMKGPDKNPFNVASSSPQHPTGFMYLDYSAGSYVNVFNEDEVPLYTYHNVGINSGTVNMIISKTQGGKTTLAIQMAAAIIEPYFNPVFYERFVKDNTPKGFKAVENAMPFIQIVDTEKTLPMDYVKKLTHYTNKQLEKRIIINQITTDTELMKLIEGHIKYKTTYMSPQVSPMLDIFGKPIIEYPPTVMIIDSMTQLMMESVDDPTKIDDKKAGIMAQYDAATKGPAGAQRAKVISALYSELVSYAKKFNIIIFSINHINKMPAIMGIPVKGMRNLRAGEVISGGERAMYLASSILRLDVIKSINPESASAINIGDNIKGHVALASWPKCKTNSRNNTCHLCFTNINGYDQLLSTLWHAKECGDLAKKGNYYFVDRYPEYSFTFKNYSDVFGSHPELFQALYDQIRDKASKMLDNTQDAEAARKKELEQARDELYEDYKNGDISRGDAEDMDDMFAQLMNS